MRRIALSLFAAALAAGTIVISSSDTHAAEWRKGAFPYAKQHHRVCQAKAIRLWRFERRAVSDHKLTKGELALVIALKRDLDKTCGRYRLGRVTALKPGGWNKSAYPYARKHHQTCQRKAIRLWRFERSVAADHKLTKVELALVVALKRDLDRTCGRYRYRR